MYVYTTSLNLVYAAGELPNASATMNTVPCWLPICVSPVQVSTSNVVIPLPFVIVNFLLVVALTYGVVHVPFKDKLPLNIESPSIVTSPVTELTSNTVFSEEVSQPFLTANFLATCVSVSLSSNISPSLPVVVRVRIT